MNKIRNNIFRIKKIGLFVFFVYISLFFVSNLSFSLEYPKFLEQEIIVTGIKLPALKKLSPWDVRLIKPEALKLTLADTLRDSLGIDIKAAGAWGSVATARLRGTTSQHVLVLKNGVRINSPLLGLVDFNDILLSGIEKIEIVKSPLSSIYGSDAIGGVINIITPGNNLKETKFSFSSGSYSSNRFSASNSSDFSGLINSLTSLNYVNSYGFRQNSDYTGYGVFQNFSDDEDKASIMLDYYSADKGVPSVPNSQTDPYSASTPNDRQKDQNLYSTLNFDADFGNLKQNIKLYNKQWYQKFHSYDFSSQVFTDTEYHANQKGFELSHNIGSYLYGVEAKEDLGQSPYIGKHVVNNYALFFQENLQHDLFSLVLGSRLDKYSTFGYFMSPRIGLNLPISPDFIFKASYGYAFKAPTLNDLYWNDTIWQMYGNSSLIPEKSKSLEFSFERYFGEIAQLSVSYYRTSITDLIMWEWNTQTNITLAKNIGGVESYGTEIEYSHKFGKGLVSFINCTLQKSEDVNDITANNIGKILPYTPYFKYNCGIKAGNDVKLNLRYVGNRFADSANTIRVPEYTIVDLVAKKKIDNSRYYIGLEIDNIFNQVYYESLGYHPTNYSQLFYPMPGRTITISMGGSI